MSPRDGKWIVTWTNPQTQEQMSRAFKAYLEAVRKHRSLEHCIPESDPCITREGVKA